MNGLSFERLSVDSLHDFLNYFDHEAFVDNEQWAGCYCQFYLNDPSAVGSQPTSKDLNRKSACDRVESGDMDGYLAYRDGKVIGWCAAGSSLLFPGLPDANDKLARILCFVIHPDHRCEGVATAMLNHAIEDLRARGFSAIEAAPYTAPKQQAKNYRGHLSMYQRVGFEVMADMGDFGVLVRKHLD